MILDFGFMQYVLRTYVLYLIFANIQIKRKMITGCSIGQRQWAPSLGVIQTNDQMIATGWRRSRQG